MGVHSNTYFWAVGIPGTLDHTPITHPFSKENTKLHKHKKSWGSKRERKKECKNCKNKKKDKKKKKKRKNRQLKKKNAMKECCRLTWGCSPTSHCHRKHDSSPSSLFQRSHSVWTHPSPAPGTSSRTLPGGPGKSPAWKPEWHLMERNKWGQLTPKILKSMS